MKTTNITEETIMNFVQRQSEAARNIANDAVADTARRAAALGFTNNAGTRLVSFLEDFRSDDVHGEYYSKHYPNCTFLPWRGFHRVLQTLNLWCDTPANYAGGVPPEQLPWLEIFELDIKDQPTVYDMMTALGMRVDRDAWQFETLLRYCAPQWTNAGAIGFVHAHHSPRQVAEYERMLDDNNNFHATVRSQIARATQAVEEFTQGFMVIAPPGAFFSTKDWITRTRELLAETRRPVQVVDDPLVVRAVRGGVLVVAAWGDEAKELNAITNQLKI